MARRRTSSPASTTCELRLAPRIKMSFQRIEPGEFWMGSRGESQYEEPRHRVRITRPFYVGTYPVTQREFAVWTKSAGIEHENGFPGRPHHPAEGLDWHQASSFCEWLSVECVRDLPSGFRAALPTEAQWEYACRAGTDTEYYTGDGAAALAAAGWYDDNSDGATHRVGEKLPNAWGLHDLHGNVWEWCLDAWDKWAYRGRVSGVCDPVVSAEDVGESNPPRVRRGGSWFGSARGCRSAIRYRNRSDNRFWVVGFRVCLVPGPVPRGGGAADREGVAEPSRGDGGRGTRPESERVGGADDSRDAWGSAVLPPT